VGGIDADHGGDQVQGRVHASRDSAAGDDSKPTELHVLPLDQALAPLAQLESIAALPRDALASSLGAGEIWTFVEDEGVLVEVLAQVKAGIVDYIALFHHVGALEIAKLGSLDAHVLESGVVVGVGGGTESLQDARFGEEERASADGEEGTLLAGILLLQLGVGFDEVHGLGVGLEDGLDASAGDDEDVVVLNVLMGVIKVDVSFECGPLSRFYTLRGSSNGEFKGFGGCCMYLLVCSSRRWQRQRGH
jgi:hypothetical protein